MRLGLYDLWSNEIDYSVDESLLELFYNRVKKFIPLIEKGDLNPDMAGIKVKRYGQGEKSRDFVIKEERANGFPNFINLIAIESPGLTSFPAIGIEIKEIVKKL